MQDYEVTRKLDEASKIIGIELVDHIVIGNSEFTSIKTIEKWKDKINLSNQNGDEKKGMKIQ